MEKDNHIGLAIKRRREQKGLSIGQLAYKTQPGVTKTAISLIESGKTQNPLLDTVLQVATALETTPNDLLIDCGLLEPPDPDTVWQPELLVMQRILQHLERLDPEMRQDAGRVVIAQAHAWEQISKLQSPEESENIQQDEDINKTL